MNVGGVIMRMRNHDGLQPTEILDKINGLMVEKSYEVP